MSPSLLTNPSARPLNDLQQQFGDRMACLEPLIAAALQVRRGEAAAIKAVADFAREKGRSGDPGAALQALDAVDQLLFASALQPAGGSRHGDGLLLAPASAFLQRLSPLMARVIAAQAAAEPSAVGLMSKAGEAVALANQRALGQAHALLDEIEHLLDRTSAS